MFAKVTSYSVNDGEYGSDERIELQIQSISVIEDESTEFTDED